MIYNLLEKKEYITEFVTLCIKTWGHYNSEEELKEKIKTKTAKVLKNDNVYATLVLEENNTLIGFISLFKTDGEECLELTPWYATMYVKDSFRGKGYSKILNEAILKKAKELKFKKVYLKSNLVNYYEKFGAKFIKNLKNGEKLYYIDL